MRNLSVWIQSDQAAAFTLVYPILKNLHVHLLRVSFKAELKCPTLSNREPTEGRVTSEMLTVCFLCIKGRVEVMGIIMRLNAG